MFPLLPSIAYNVLLISEFMWTHYRRWPQLLMT